MSTRRSKVLAATIAAAALASAAACSSEDTTSTSGTSAPSGTTAGTTRGSVVQGILVAGAWCRESPMVSGAGACYARIANNTSADDALVGVTVSGDVAAEAQLHETTMGATGSTMGGEMGGTGSTMGSTMGSDMAGTGTTMGGDMMTMAEVDEIALPAGETVELKPGSYHIMLMELVEPLEAGQSVELTLEFAEAGTQTITFEVRTS